MTKKENPNDRFFMPALLECGCCIYMICLYCDIGSLWRLLVGIGAGIASVVMFILAFRLSPDDQSKASS